MESQKEKQKDGYTTPVAFPFLIFFLQKEKTEISITDHISIFLFLFVD